MLNGFRAQADDLIDGGAQRSGDLRLADGHVEAHATGALSIAERDAQQPVDLARRATHRDRGSLGGRHCLQTGTAQPLDDLLNARVREAEAGAELIRAEVLPIARRAWSSEAGQVFIQLCRARQMEADAEADALIGRCRAQIERRCGCAGLGSVARRSATLLLRGYANRSAAICGLRATHQREQQRAHRNGTEPVHGRLHLNVLRIWSAANRTACCCVSPP